MHVAKCCGAVDYRTAYVNRRWYNSIIILLSSNFSMFVVLISEFFFPLQLISHQPSLIALACFAECICDFAGRQLISLTVVWSSDLCHCAMLVLGL